MILCCANVLHRSSSMTNTSPIVLYTHTYVLTHTHTKCSCFFLWTLNYSQTLIFSNSSRSHRNTCTRLYIYTHTHTHLHTRQYIPYFIYSLGWISYPVSHWAVSHKQCIFAHTCAHVGACVIVLWRFGGQYERRHFSSIFPRGSWKV